jgi:MFS family permease
VLQGAGLAALVFARHGYPVLVIAVLLMAAGEMIYAPTVSAFVTTRAGRHRRATYQAALSITEDIGTAIGPISGLALAAATPGPPAPSCPPSPEPEPVSPPRRARLNIRGSPGRHRPSQAHRPPANGPLAYRARALLAFVALPVPRNPAARSGPPEHPDLHGQAPVQRHVGWHPYRLSRRSHAGAVTEV